MEIYTYANYVGSVSDMLESRLNCGHSYPLFIDMLDRKRERIHFSNST